VESLRPISNPNMASDLISAAALAQAAIRGALSNVDINLAEIKDAGFIGEIRSKIEVLQG